MGHELRMKNYTKKILGIFLRAFRTVSLFVLDSFCFLIPAKRYPVSVVVRLDAIGDLFIWMQSGAVQVAEYARLDSHRSVLIANDAWASYAIETAMWDEVIAVSPVRLMRHPLYRFRMLRRIRMLGAHQLIQPRAAKVFLQEDAVARTCGAARRVGNAGTSINLTPKLHSLGNFYYEELIEVAESRDMHEVVRNAHFASTLTGRPVTRYPFPPSNRSVGRKTIAVAIGAGEAGRVWPIEYFGALIEHLFLKHPDHQIILVGASGELENSARLEELIEASVSNRVAKTTLSEYIDLVCSADLVICNDSSAYHIAVASRTKVICFLGGGHFGWYAPYPPDTAQSGRAIVLNMPMECYWCNWRCRYPRTKGGTFRCVSSIAVSAAINAAESLLP